jgi:hypothetical protein
VALADKAADRTQEGKVVKAGEGKLTVTTANTRTQTFLVPATARILCDGKECRLEDLKPGSTVKVTMKGDGDRAVSRVEATTEPE